MSKKIAPMPNTDPSFWDACAENDLLHIVGFLADPNLDVNEVDEQGKTPFFVACEKGNLETVRLLLADPRVAVNQADNRGMTPLGQCLVRRIMHVPELSVIELFELLVRNERIDLNQEFNQTWLPIISPIFFVVQRGQLELLKFLLQTARININKVQDNLTVLQYACRIFRPGEIIDQLLAYRQTDINLVNAAGDSAMHLACQSYNLAAVECLLASNLRMELTKPNLAGNTPLQLLLEQHLKPTNFNNFPNRDRVNQIIVKMLAHHLFWTSIEENPHKNETCDLIQEITAPRTFSSEEQHSMIVKILPSFNISGHGKFWIECVFPGFSPNRLGEITNIVRSHQDRLANSTVPDTALQAQAALPATSQSGPVN